MLPQQLLQVRREGLVEVDDARVRDAPPVRDGPPPQQVHAGHLDLLPVVRPRHVRHAAHDRGHVPRRAPLPYDGLQGLGEGVVAPAQLDERVRVARGRRRRQRVRVAGVRDLHEEHDADVVDLRVAVPGDEGLRRDERVAEVRRRVEQGLDRVVDLGRADAHAAGVERGVAPAVNN